MLFQKSYWVNVTADVDVLPLIHDVKLAIRESGVEQGLLTVHVPDGCGAMVLAPEGLEEDRAFRRWIKDWTVERKGQGEPASLAYIASVLGPSLTVPLEGKEMTIDVRAGIYLVDLTDQETRRQYYVSIMSESPPQQQGAQPRGPVRR